MPGLQQGGVPLASLQNPVASEFRALEFMAPPALPIVPNVVAMILETVEPVRARYQVFFSIAARDPIEPGKS
jgi:hypothetical protein